MSRAEYMRLYRAKRKGQPEAILDVVRDRATVETGDCRELILENGRLTEEIARLKRELSARSIGPSFGYPRPAPKPSRHG